MSMDPSSSTLSTPALPSPQLPPSPSFDNRSTLSRKEARDVYDGFAIAAREKENSSNQKEDGSNIQADQEQDNNEKDTTAAVIGGNDVASGYGGPAITALRRMAQFDTAQNVFEFGTGQGKLATLVLSTSEEKQKGGPNNNNNQTGNGSLRWVGIDQSPLMVDGFRRNCVDKFGLDKCSIELLTTGNPSDLKGRWTKGSFDRFVSTYVLDLLSEEDMYKVLDLAEEVLDPSTGRLLLAGITWGYRQGTIQTFIMTAIWELLYQVWRKKVGGCRPQALEPYLKARGWTIEESVTTLPNGYPWMKSEVICARPPTYSSQSTDII